MLPRDQRVLILETASFESHRPLDMDPNVKFTKLAKRLNETGLREQFEQSTFWHPTMIAERGRIPIQIIAGQLAQAVCLTAEHLAEMEDTFDYGNQIAIVRERNVVVLSPDRLAHELGLKFEYWRRGSEGATIALNPPKPLVAQLIALERDRNLPLLSGVVDLPVTRLDGTVLSKPGFDPASNLFLALGEQPPPKIPDVPSSSEVADALPTLWYPVSKFPFVSDAARGGMLAALLTAVIRKVLPTAPAFAFDAPTRGSGKTLLAN